MFVGWDWGNTAHDVTVIDTAGARLDRWAVPHTEDGLARVLAKLACHGDPGELPVAIETTRGLVVDRLLAAGHPVIPIHPNAFHAARPRWGAARAKSDPGDSFKLADYARTDIHRLPALAPTLRETLELQALTRQRDDQLALRIAAVNQLAALLDAHWPGGKTIFAQLHSPIALDFLDRYPTPQTAAVLTPAKIEAFCKRRSYSGRRGGAELLARLRAAPVSASRLGEPVVEQLIRAQAGLVRALQAGIDALDTAIADAVAAHPYAQLMADLPRIGTLNLAQIIGEVGPILERADSFEQLTIETGIAPVTRASGKSHVVAFRHAVNRRARQALHTWLDNSRRGDPWAAGRYAQARARGQRHPHALRTLGRAWLRIIWACWRTKTAYNSARHETGKQPIAA